jgi:integrase
MIMTLTDMAIRNAAPKAKPYKMSDGGGMYILIQPNGNKLWRKKYRFAGKEKLLSMGPYPRVSLTEARAAREAAFETLEQGQDPSFLKQEKKRQLAQAAGNNFEKVAHAWWENKRDGWSEKHAAIVLRTLKLNIFPYIGSRPVSEISPPELLEVIRKIEQRGSLEIASKVLQRCNSVFRFAIITGLTAYNPATDLREGLKTPPQRNHPALKESELPAFFEKFAVYDGHLLTKLALRFLILTFVRSNEMRGAYWEEFDLEKAEWRVPAERMKMKVEHIVPLSTQAITLIEQLRGVNGHRELVFASMVNPKKPISGNALLFALYRMGYHSRATVHGFRQTASTILNENGFSADAIERQLAHAEGNKIRAAYNKAEYLPERRKMMQWWAEYLDNSHTGVKITKR